MYYVAAEAGLRYQWSSIYDLAILRSLSMSFPAGERVIEYRLTYASPPLIAWLFAPLTAFSEPVAYLLWTLLAFASLVLAWRIAAPFTGLAKLTLLLLALALWPVLLNFYEGQPNMFLIALIAAAWRLCVKDRPLTAGSLIAVAMFLKPQAVLLLPLALLVSGRYRVVAGWAAGCVILGSATAATLGLHGLQAWWQTIRGIHGLTLNTDFTLAFLLGFGPITYLLWGVQGAMALWIAWWRRRELEIVLAAGILGTVATASYLHEADYSNLVLAAWLVLRTSPPVWHRLWLVLGVVTMQVMTYGPQTAQPVWELATHAPQLIWDAGWLLILMASSYPRNVESAHPAPQDLPSDARAGA